MKLLSRKPLLVSNGIYELIGAAALALVPWMAWLAHLLPTEHFDSHFVWMWEILDVGEFVTLALTTYYGIKRSGWVVVTAAIAGSLLLADAWFDVFTSSAGIDSEMAIGSAVFIEIPLALLAFWIAFRVGKKYFH